MKEKDDFEFKEVNDIIEGENQESLKKLSLYSKVLEKEGNIFIRFKKHRHPIHLKSNVSFFRICSLGEIYPEENVLFTLYAMLSDESESESDNKKGIDKLKERLSENDEKNKKVTKLRSKKPKKKDKNIDKEKEDKDSVILLDEVKSSVQIIMNKKGNTIAKNFDVYKLLWRNLYKWLLLFPLVISFGLIYHIYKDRFAFSFAGLIAVIFIFVISYTSFSGNSKMKSKKRVNFNKENYLLYSIIAFSCYFLASTILKFDIAAYNFLSQYKTFVYITFCSLIILSAILICLNIKMVKFHKKYSEILESGILLEDREP
jgi:hypothetical protein